MKEKLEFTSAALSKTAVVALSTPGIAWRVARGFASDISLSKASKASCRS